MKIFLDKQKLSGVATRLAKQKLKIAERGSLSWREITNGNSTQYEGMKSVRNGKYVVNILLCPYINFFRRQPFKAKSKAKQK